MSRVCEFTGKRPMTGHNVSHAKNRTNRIFRPNLCNVSLLSDKLGRSFKFRISAHALRSVDHVGGLDAFLTKAKEDQLSASARKVKREIANAS